MEQSRRKFLQQSGIIGCSLAASPLVTPVTFAAAPWDHRLVVILLRGAMDGLEAIRPVGDPDFARLRPKLAEMDGTPLQSQFKAHPALDPLMPLWASGELAVVNAVSTPYRNGRSHFDGQDLLEAGQPTLRAFKRKGREGWLNRMLTLVPQTRVDTAFAVGQEELMLLSGDADVSRWAPGQMMALSPETDLLLERIYDGDPLFHAASQQALALTGDIAAEQMEAGEDMATMGQNMATAFRASRAQPLAEFTASRLNRDARIAAFSITGWDTHRNQVSAIHRPLSELATAILTLKAELGANWSKTAVLAMTEFGRTARANGSNGTDHGTGGAMIAAGGAIKGGQIYGGWPGLRDADLYQGRDLMPLGDIRAYAGLVMQDLFGLSAREVEQVVFPGLDLDDGARITA